jgi:hypothetical protein
MPDFHTRLLETAVRPMAGDPEIQLAASQMLSEQVRPDGHGAEEAIARWDAVDARTWRLWGWNRLLFWVLVCLSVVVWVPTLLGYFELTRLLKSLTRDDKPSIESVVRKHFGNHLSARQKLTLFGSDAQSSAAEKIKALWDSQPTNSVYYSAYARIYLEEKKQLPPDFLEFTRLIDPENAWFTYLTAAVEAEGGYEKNIASKSNNDSTPPWKILDLAKLEKAAALLHEACDQPRCQDYLAEITREKIQALSVTTQMDNLVANFYLAAQSKADILAVRKLACAMSAYGWSLGEAGDTATFQKLLLDTDALVQSTSQMQASDLKEAFSLRSIAATHAGKFAAVSRKLGLLDDAAHLEKIQQRMEVEKLSRKDRKHLTKGKEYGENGGLFASISLSMQASSVANPPLFADRYLLPGRLADHEMVSSICCFCAAPFLGLFLILAGVFKNEGQEPIKLTLAKRISELILPIDWCWILGLGVVSPAVYLVILERYRPVVGLNHDNFGSNLLILPMFYSSLLCATFTSIPAIVARWRLAKRAKVLGFTRCSPRIGALVVLWNIAQFPLLSLMPSGTTSSIAFYGVGFLFMICALATVSFSVIDRRTQPIKSSTLSQFLDPASALAAIFLLCLIPIFKAAQHRAFEQDRISKIDPAFPAESPYECRVAAQMQKETRAILGDEK